MLLVAPLRDDVDNPFAPKNDEEEWKEKKDEEEEDKDEDKDNNNDETPEKKEPIEKALETLKEAHKSQDLEAIEKATAELNTHWQAASEELYKESQAQQGAEATADAGQATGDDKKDDQEVTDVDFEEVK